jgi:hypothetical protein
MEQPLSLNPRPFTVDIPQSALDDLATRLNLVRWPEKETVSDWSQGVPLAEAKRVVDYWRNSYDWRRCETTINARDNFLVEIDGLDIHFMHVRSPHENALPMIMTHGWPGSVIEFLEVIDPLVNPTAHGGSGGSGLPPRHPLAARIRLFRQADRNRLVGRSHRAGLGQADAGPWL